LENISKEDEELEKAEAEKNFILDFL